MAQKARYLVVKETDCICKNGCKACNNTRVIRSYVELSEAIASLDIVLEVAPPIRTIDMKGVRLEPIETQLTFWEMDIPPRKDFKLESGQLVELQYHKESATDEDLYNFFYTDHGAKPES